MFLLDTNCFMQLVRRRPEAPQVQALLDGVPRSELFITVYALHSIGGVMRRFGQIADFPAFINDLGIGRTLRIVGLDVKSLAEVAAACDRYNLDFDDAFQYVAAELNNLRLVSLDDDFDRTPSGRLTPTIALELFRNEQRQPPSP